MALTLCQQCGNEYDDGLGKCPGCGSTFNISLVPRADPLLGKMVAGRYRVLSKLGQGGMGAVYLAEQEGLGHRVALKFLSASFSQDVDVARRFLNEAKSYARVAHPNAVVLHDFGQDESGNLFISMELVEGSDLKRILNERARLPAPEAVDIILQVADVLGYAHAKGVIHRDLKPENIMVRQSMRGSHVKVLDFGIARLIDGGARMTQQGSIAGTPRYMAPEQVEGTDVDARADIYAVGVLLFELLTGLDPFDGATVSEILNNQLHQPMPHLHERIPGFALPELDAVIQKAASKSRDERYPSMAAFAAALTSAVPSANTRPAIQLAGTQPSLTPSAPEGTPGPGERVAPRGRKISDTLVRTPLPELSVAPPRAEPSAARVPTGASPRTWSVVAVALVVGAGSAVVAWTRLHAPEGRVVAVTPMQPPAAPPGSSAAVNNVAAPLPAVTDTDSLREAAFAREQLLKAQAEFLAGRIPVADGILETVPDHEKVREDIRALRASIDEVKSLLLKGRSARVAGECEAAIVSFDKVLRKYPQVSEAGVGKRECLRQRPPDSSE